jgi:hypothetical protein
VFIYLLLLLFIINYELNFNNECMYDENHNFEKKKHVSIFILFRFIKVFSLLNKKLLKMQIGTHNGSFHCDEGKKIMKLNLILAIEI